MYRSCSKGQPYNTAHKEECHILYPIEPQTILTISDCHKHIICYRPGQRLGHIMFSELLTVLAHNTSVVDSYPRCS